MTSTESSQRARRPVILHLDVDAFFASVEQLLIPRLRDRPVIVGNGVIASCSYEARAFGCSAGMPLHQARRRCPQAVILDGNYQIYRCFADHVWEVCRRYTCGLDTYLDEAYGDATGLEHVHGPPETLGRKLQQEVLREVGLPVSVGLADNRMLAKIASGAGKPRGVVYVPAENAPTFLAPLPIEKIPGVGRKTARILHDMNIHRVAELQTLDRSLLRELFGRRGEDLHDLVRGRDHRPIPTLRPRPPRSISRETTFHQPMTDRAEILGMLHYLLQRAARAVREGRLLVGCVQVTLGYEDWRRVEMQRSLREPSDDDETLYQLAGDLLGTLYRRRVSLRHLGVTFTKFTKAGDRPRLFDEPPLARNRRLNRTLDTIRDRWGHAAVVSGKSIELMGRLEQNDHGFVLRTPSLTK